MITMSNIALLTCGATALVLDFVRFLILGNPVTHVFGINTRTPRHTIPFRIPNLMTPAKRWWSFYNYYVSYFLYGLGLWGVTRVFGDALLSFFGSSSSSTSTSSSLFFPFFTSGGGFYYLISCLGLCICNTLIGLLSSFYVVAIDDEQGGPAAGIAFFLSGASSFVATFLASLYFGLFVASSSSSNNNNNFDQVVFWGQNLIPPIVISWLLFGRKHASD